MIRLFSLLFATFLLSGCLATRTVQNQTITIDTPMVAGAECELTDTRGHKWYLNETPGTATVLKGYGPITVQCDKDGYQRSIVTIQDEYGNPKDYQHMATATAMVLFDPTANIGKEFPNKLVVLMEPKQFASEQERIDWLTAKHSYEKMYQEERDAKRLEEIEEASKHFDQKVIDAVKEKHKKAQIQEKAEDSTIRRAETADRINRIRDGLDYRNKQRSGGEKAISNDAAPLSENTPDTNRPKTIGELSAEERRKEAWKEAFSDGGDGTLIIKQVPDAPAKKDFSKHAVAKKEEKPASVIASEAMPDDSVIRGEEGNAEASAAMPEPRKKNQKFGKIPLNPNEPIPLIPGE